VTVSPRLGPIRTTAPALATAELAWVVRRRLLPGHHLAIEMESELDRKWETPRAVQPVAARRLALMSKERAARWRLELAETRTHPFQTTKVYFCPAALSE